MSIPNPQSPIPRHTLAHEAMATTFKITVVHADAIYARQAAAEAFAELDRIEGRLSRFIESSDVSRVNRLLRGQSTAVQPDTLECLRIAVEVQRETQGAFDVAHGCEDPSAPRPPFELDDPGPSIRVLADGVSLDLGGIGKGFALDRMAAILTDWDVGPALLAASTSTLLVVGTPPGQAGWALTFGPDDDVRRFDLARGAVSGSGTEIKGSHVIDPRSGRPVQGRRSAWAFAPAAATADALSTAFLVMTEEEVRGYCGRHPEVSAFLPQSESDKAR